jgi:type II secretory ATPase GspE/PulE/Tfp pilus assembly ATPase PilB-like protein
LYELLKVTEPLREMIVQRKSNTEIKALLKPEMVTIQQDALLKVTAGETSLEEALRVAFGDAS